MLRRSVKRLGHQLIKEPMGHEENTYARGVRTFNHTVNEVNLLLASAAVGSVFAFFSMRTSSLRHHQRVTADGKLVKI